MVLVELGEGANEFAKVAWTTFRKISELLPKAIGEAFVKSVGKRVIVPGRKEG